MNEICRFNDMLSIHEDENDWIKIEDGKEISRISKNDKPFYPLAMTTKFDWTPINIERLEELIIQWEKEWDEGKK